jgi:hypothetical protein
MYATGIFYCQIYSSLLPDRQPFYVNMALPGSADVYPYGLLGALAYVGEDNKDKG